MSRIGKKPVKIPEKVKVAIHGDKVVAEGPLGKLDLAIDPAVALALQDGAVLVTPREAGKLGSCRQGLMRNLVRNMVEGVHAGFRKELEITGVGYRAEVKGDRLNLDRKSV